MRLYNYLMEKFQNNYCVSSSRLPKYDYSRAGYYFVTICTQNKKCHFGRVVGHEVQLSEIGKIVKEEILKTPQIRPNVSLDQWIIMPNHIHAIIVIHNVETHCNASLQYHNVFGPQKNNLASIVRGFKSAATKRINSAFGQNYFSWQPRFYDHVIRNEKSLQNIRQYIASNVGKWLMDEMYAPNLK